MPLDDSGRPVGIETAPSDVTAEEPSFPRLAGTIGLGLVLVGGLAVWMNLATDKPRLIGPATGSFLFLVGIATMLYHAARDSDRMVRRLYLGLGFAGIVAGVVLSIVPPPGTANAHMSDWFLPWGASALLGGLFFLLAAGRHEHESPWPLAMAATSGLIGLAGAAIGLIGIGATQIDINLVPRLAGIAFLGLIFLWVAAVRLNTNANAGYRLGQLIGLVGLVAIAWGLGRSVIPPMLYSMNWLLNAPDRYFMPRGIAEMSLGLLFVMLAYGLISDRPVVAMTRRELAAYFYSPIAYIVLMGMTFIGWLQYSDFLVRLVTRQGAQEPVVSGYIVTILPVFTIMFVVPVITMRLFSEEKRTGTIEVLLTGPVNEVSVVVSKFLAGLFYFFFLLVPWGLFLIPIYLEGREGFDYLPLVSFYVALIASGAAFVSMGVFFSSLTRNQIIAASLTFAGMAAYLSLIYIPQSVAGPLRAVIDQFSFIEVWFNALSGKLYLHNVITYLSVTVFWLFLTVKVLEARKWN